MKIVTLVASLLLSRSVSGFFIPAKNVVKRSLALRSVETGSRPEKKIVLEDFDEYSSHLSPKEERDDVLSEETEFQGKKSRWKKAVRYPVDIAQKVIPIKSKKTKRGALILLRCGESTFNANQTFTGWLDPDLTEQGVQEIEHAGRLLLAEGFEPDVVYTSRLKRAIKSAWTLLEEIGALYTPVFKSYRLNQRAYGSLQGLPKKQTAQEFGSEVVQAWRNSLKARPPPLKPDDPNHPKNDRRYSDLPEDRLPSTESLLDCQERARPIWEHKIRKDIRKGKTVLVVAHRDSLRGLAKVIDGIGDDDINEISIPTGIPFVYRFDKDMKPIKPEDEALTQVHTTSVFLEKPGALKEALKRQERWSEALPGIDQKVKRVSTMEESLRKLRVEQNLMEGIDDDEAVILAENAPAKSQVVERWTDDPSEFEEYDFFASGLDEDDAVPTVTVEPLSKDKSAGESPEKRDGPFVVLIRHGRTPHNNLGLFTGWEDPPLATGGVEDAKNAGRVLRKHGFEFDVVYTSWLTRAIQTALYVVDELDSTWLPIVKSWRLNERMYGDLTGKSKKMIANQYGEDQLKKWRRGYTIKPPPTSSYSLSYPGNDVRRTKHFKDLKISWPETIVRSLEQRKLVVHRKFPKCESLKDCMDRSIPFYTKRIKEEAVNKKKRVLITSHENAIRGILMHLCDIPEEAMNQLHLPNGLPLVYNVKGRCISLLDDGSGRDPMEIHDFGPAAKYLFKPCELDDAFFDEMAAKA